MYVILHANPLDKCRFICTVISCIPVEIQCFFILRSCQQHHLVTAFLLSNYLRIIQAFCRIALASVICMCDNILHECIRADISCQVQNDHADTGGYNFLIYNLYDQVMILILEYPPSYICQMHQHFRNGILMQI